MGTLNKTDLEARYNHATTGLFKTNTSNAIGSDDLRDLVEYLCDSLASAFYRGAYDASGNTYPASGGSGTSGAIQAGDLYYFSVAATSLDGGAWPVGTIAIALVNTPGQTTTNWRLL